MSTHVNNIIMLHINRRNFLTEWSCRQHIILLGLHGYSFPANAYSIRLLHSFYFLEQKWFIMIYEVFTFSAVLLFKFITTNRSRYFIWEMTGNIDININSCLWVCCCCCCFMITIWLFYRSARILFLLLWKLYCWNDMVCIWLWLLMFQVYEIIETVVYDHSGNVILFAARLRSSH